jgi:protein O-GlcNAc transferase
VTRHPTSSNADGLLAKAVAAHQHGDLDTAEAAYRQVLLIEPGLAAAHALLGVVYGQRNDLAEAAACLDRALELDPANVSAHHNRGEIARRQGDLPVAHAFFQQALALDSTFVEAYISDGFVLKRLGQTMEARAAYQRAVTLRPDHALAHYNLANLLREAGQLVAATEAYRGALAAQPGMVNALLNLGATFEQLGQLDAAERAYQEALTGDPRCADAHRNLGALYVARGDLASAAEHYNATLALCPEDDQTALRLGDILLDLGRPEAAVTVFGHLCERSPDAATHSGYGAALTMLGRHVEALASYAAAARHAPNDRSAQSNLALAYAQVGQLDAARATFQALRAEVSQRAGVSSAQARTDAVLRLRLAALCPRVMQDTADIDAYRGSLGAELAALGHGAISLTADQVAADGVPPPFALTYHGRDDRRLKEAWAAIFSVSQPPEPRARRTGPPHIGVVVTAGHERVFLRSMRGLLAGLAVYPLRVTVYCSSLASAVYLRAVLAPSAVGVVAGPGGVTGLLEALQAARCDVLWYWEVGTDAVNYFLPFFRPAPLQCVSWGTPVTTGLPAIDYYLSSVSLEPPLAERQYTEQLVQFKHLPVCAPRPSLLERPLSRTQIGLQDNQHLYLCAQNVLKFHPDMDELIAEILRRDQAGVLVVMVPPGPLVEALLARWRQRLPDVMERIRIIPRMSETDYLRLVEAADVALDPPHYSGANTSYDSLAVGTPVVTLRGPFQRGRYTAALYEKMLLTACVADTPSAYIETALALGSDRSYRAVVSAHIRSTAGDLFDDTSAVDELAAFFQQAVSA